VASREVWLLCRATRRDEARQMASTLARHFGVTPRIVCADHRGAVAEGVGGAATAYHEAFGRLNAPAGIVDLADGHPVFALLREWLAMNHVPVLALPHDRPGFGLGHGVRAFLAELSEAAPAWRRRPAQPPGWASSGWDAVVAACADDARR